MDSRREVRARCNNKKLETKMLTEAEEQRRILSGDVRQVPKWAAGRGWVKRERLHCIRYAVHVCVCKCFPVDVTLL